MSLTNEEHIPYLVIPTIFIGLQPRHGEKEKGCSKLIRILTVSLISQPKKEM